MFDEVVFDDGDEEDGKDGEKEEEAGPLGMLKLAGKDCGKEKDEGNEGAGKEEEDSGEPCAVTEDFACEPCEEEKQDEDWGDFEEFG